MNAPSRLQRFFENYAATSLGPDPNALAAMYADSFLVAGLEGSAAFTNDERFLDWVHQLHEFNQDTGMTGMTVISTEELPLSDAFSIATVEWGATFEKTGADLITFKISYILQKRNEDLTILGYISHESQTEEMRARGLL